VSFTAFTWNVLADGYLDRRFYPRSPSAALEPEGRRARVVERAVALEADLLLLQEVEPATFAALAARLPDHAAHFAPKGADRPDGVGALVRRSALLVRSTTTLAFDDAIAGRKASGMVALLLELDALTVAVTHLTWDAPDAPPERRRAPRQVAQLLAALPARTRLVAGDLNAGVDDAPVRALLESGLQDAFAARPQALTCVANARARRIDFLLHSADLAATPLDLPAITDEAVLPSLDEPSDHLPVGVRLQSRP
jgi:endonuclease/exonuclease/phosphatase family metal-dependent hydrolase